MDDDLFSNLVEWVEDLFDWLVRCRNHYTLGQLHMPQKVKRFHELHWLLCPVHCIGLVAETLAV